MPGSERILSAAEQLFARHGFAGTSAQAVAAAAGVSKAAVFHHFRSKESLYLEIVSAASRDFGEELAARLPESAGFDQRVELFASQQLQHMLRRDQVSRIVLREIAETRAERGRRRIAKVLGVNFARLLDLLRHGQVEGLVRADVDCAATACLLIAANVFFFEARHVLGYLPAVSFADDPRTYSALTTRLVLEGIIAKRPGRRNRRS